MASNKNIKKLFMAVRQRDWSLVDEAAQEICKTEDKKGHHTASRMLRSVLEPNGRLADPRGNGAANRPFSILPPALALNEVHTDSSLDDVRLPQPIRRQLTQFLDEWRHRQLFASAKLTVRTKLLIHGPPGCGKSLTAAAIGRELDLPVYVVRFDAIIASYLGQTAVHLRQLFQFAESSPCILLIDEVDALGKRRGHPSDVGELDRIVVALLQELEHARPLGVVVATSNMARQLDTALFRRFDLILELPRPTKRQLIEYAVGLARSLSVSLSQAFRRRITSTDNYATVRQLIEAEARQKLLQVSRENGDGAQQSQ